MLGKLLPILLALAGLGAGVGAGVALRPEPGPAHVELSNPCGDVQGDGAPHTTPEDSSSEGTVYDYVKMNNQFIVPIVDEGRISSLVVLSISLEVKPGETEAIYQREPKLRDAFLQVMFGHANAGGFGGAFTNTTTMNVLRQALREAAQKTLGPTVSDVLIMDIVRQDV